MAEGSLPAAERSSGEELVAVVGSPVLGPRTPTAERSSGEELVAEGLLPAAERSSGEELAAVVENLELAAARPGDTGRYHDLDGGDHGG